MTRLAPDPQIADLKPAFDLDFIRVNAQPVKQVV